MPSLGGSGHLWVGSFLKLLGLVLVSVFNLCSRESYAHRNYATLNNNFQRRMPRLEQR